tara:strand:- start:266 stop:853 length:588 start_codon:yes stop_codon:yes gene_type:complete
MKIKKIGLIPTVLKKNNDLKYSIDKNLINFINFIFKKPKITILYSLNVSEKFDLIISSGGNNLVKFSKSQEDKTRSKLENFYLNLSLKKKISFLGICYGAQSLANQYKSKIIFDKSHAGTKHYVYSMNKKKIYVNSFHNYKIIKLNKKFDVLFKAKDDSIECFKFKGKKLLGVMWHPERYPKPKKIDIKIIKKYL